MVHTNVVPMQEIIDDSNNDKIFLIMPYLKAGSLEDRLEETLKHSSNSLATALEP